MRAKAANHGQHVRPEVTSPSEARLEDPMFVLYGLV